MLELARVFKGYNTDKDLKFIAFGSEERGLLELDTMWIN